VEEECKPNTFPVKSKREHKAIEGTSLTGKGFPDNFQNDWIEWISFICDE
jgi:hypothetical protein